MKILISSFVYKPEPIGHRAHDLAAGLAELGHDVTSITGLPSYPQGRIYDGYKVKLYTREDVDGVKILRFPYKLDRSNSVKRRIASYTIFSILTTIFSVIFRLRPDVIWTNQIGYPGQWLSELWSTPYVHEVQDLWPDWTKTTDLGMKEGFYNFLENQQMRIYKNSTHITVISKGFKHWLLVKGIPSKKIDIIPNWVNPKQFLQVPRDNYLGIKEGLRDRFNVMYVGNVGAAQGLDVILDAASLISHLKPIQFVIIGDGLEKHNLEQNAKEKNLNNVHFLGHRPAESIADYLMWADVLFLHLKKDPLLDITIPSKVYSYLASGRPILAAASGEVTDMICEFQAGKTVEPENPVAIANSVIELFNMTRSEREEYGINASKAFIKYFDRNKLIQKYETIFTQVVNDQNAYKNS